MVRAFWAIALAILLTACGTVGQTPGKDLVKRAIALQLSQIQQELSQQLRLEDQITDISMGRVAIDQQIPLEIDTLASFHITGKCDYTMNLPTRSISQRNIPFEVYLQRQQEGKTWRVAFPKTRDDGELTWVTQRIPTPIYE